MTKVVSPSSFNPMTSGQMTKFYELLVAALRKSNLPSEPTQDVLENHGGALADECVSLFRKRVEAISTMIVRHVMVNRDRASQAMLDATGRKQYTDCNVVDMIPRGEGTEVAVHFFKPDKSAYDKNGNISDDNLAKEYELRGLKPDPYAVAAVNEADPVFADDHPNGAPFKDEDGNWCYIAFDRRCGGRRVGVNRYNDDWDDFWSFGGVRK